MRNNIVYDYFSKRRIKYILQKLKLLIPTKLTDLKDVEITDLRDGQVLTWDAMANKWVNSDPS